MKHLTNIIARDPVLRIWLDLGPGYEKTGNQTRDFATLDLALTNFDPRPLSKKATSVVVSQSSTWTWPVRGTWQGVYGLVSLVLQEGRRVSVETQCSAFQDSAAYIVHSGLG